jgi:hypothetical protein
MCLRLSLSPRLGSMGKDEEEEAEEDGCVCVDCDCEDNVFWTGLDAAKIL